MYRVGVAVGVEDSVLHVAHEVDFEEEPLVEGAREDVDVHHFEEGAQQRLVMTRVGPDKHQPFLPKDEHIML